MDLPMVFATMAAASGLRALAIIFTYGAHRANPLKIWSSKVKPPASAIGGTYSPFRFSSSRY